MFQLPLAAVCRSARMVSVLPKVIRTSGWVDPQPPALFAWASAESSHFAPDPSGRVLQDIRAPLLTVIALTRYRWAQVSEQEYE